MLPDVPMQRMRGICMACIDCQDRHARKAPEGNRLLSLLSQASHCDVRPRISQGAVGQTLRGVIPYALQRSSSSTPCGFGGYTISNHIALLLKSTDEMFIRIVPVPFSLANKVCLKSIVQTTWYLPAQERKCASKQCIGLNAAPAIHHTQ